MVSMAEAVGLLMKDRYCVLWDLQERSNWETSGNFNEGVFGVIVYSLSVKVIIAPPENCILLPL